MIKSRLSFNELNGLSLGGGAAVGTGAEEAAGAAEVADAVIKATGGELPPPLEPELFTLCSILINSCKKDSIDVLILLLKLSKSSKILSFIFLVSLIFSENSFSNSSFFNKKSVKFN